MFLLLIWLIDIKLEAVQRPANRPLTTPRPVLPPAIIVTPHSEPGIRSKARLFENDIRVAQKEEKKEEEEKDFYDEYYDYYDEITEQENRLEENRASQLTERFRSTPEVSTFPPPEQRFAAIDETDINSFRKSSKIDLLTCLYSSDHLTLDLQFFQISLFERVILVISRAKPSQMTSLESSVWVLGGDKVSQHWGRSCPPVSCQGRGPG